MNIGLLIPLLTLYGICFTCRKSKKKMLKLLSQLKEGHSEEEEEKEEHSVEIKTIMKAENNREGNNVIF